LERPEFDSTGGPWAASRWAILTLPLAVGLVLCVAASLFHQWHDYGAPPIGDGLVAVLAFVPLVILAGFAAIVGGRRSNRQLALMTALGALPSLCATLAMLYDLTLPKGDGDTFGGVIVFIWMARSALGLFAGVCGAALVAGLTRRAAPPSR
jgi:hypothetical protein